MIRYAAPLLALMLLVPAHALAQTGTINLLDNFGVFERGDDLFLFGDIALLEPDAFLILQVINPRGDICRIQQLTPISSGAFVTEPIRLQGSICGVPGSYDVRLFYGTASTRASFEVTAESGAKTLDVSSVQSAVRKVSELLDRVEGDVSEPRQRLDAPSLDISDIEDIHADIWETHRSERLISGIDPAIRPVIVSSLDATASLVLSGQITPEVARSIDRDTYSALFYHELDSKSSIDRINDAFVSIQNADPVKPVAKARTYEQLEAALSNLMTKTGSILSGPVKEEIAFVFARGTAPLYADELNQLLDMLTESRYLDVMSRKNAPLYRLVNTSWEGLRESLLEKSSIERLLDSRGTVNELYTAAVLLRDLDDVDRFISDDRQDELADIISPRWESLETRLQLASSPDDILEARDDIDQMKDVIDISSRISKVVQISRDIDVGSSLVSDWEVLLERVDAATTLPEVLAIVSEFDRSITELREERDPVTILRFQYDKMKTRAELQADYGSLNIIERALRILDTAQKQAEGNPTATKIDRIEVLLSWASAQAPVLQDKLDSYTGDVYKERASGILQRAQSIENLAELSLSAKRFLPGYVEYVESVMDRLNQARNLAVAGDLEGADDIVGELFAEWQEVNQAYADDPYGSDTGYDAEELVRIEYRKILDDYSSAVSNFYNTGFASHSGQYNQMRDEALQQIDRGNFDAAQNLLTDIGSFLSEHLVLSSPSIIYEISHDQSRDLWLLSGYIQRNTFDDRKEVTITIYDMNGRIHDTLVFTTSREGRIYTQWQAPTEPGLYVAVLDHAGQQASSIVFLEETFEQQFDSADHDLFALADEYEDLESFVERFGGSNRNEPRFASVMAQIEDGLRQRDGPEVERDLDELKRLIERYLPTRSRTAIIEAEYDGVSLQISGAVAKTLSFSEDLFVDIFDQKGQRVYEVQLKDDASGHFDQRVPAPFGSGTYVAQLEYHNDIVNDFFVVR